MFAAVFPVRGAYAVGNGAVEALTMVLARELRGRDVTVNAVALGPTATRWTARSSGPTASWSDRRHRGSRHPCLR
ncbi:SDR family oxidoreductase [Nocardia abscessus]|uniref:SDR family oxidoreductase n=1 Tax=Nocardia abscessus TaxID=120957 RepID=UPI002B4B62F5|nr:SDR family oxidoreductase [Nocardia abscessus]